MEKLFWCNKKVLVTGHTGFKGTWVSLILKHMGAKVYGISLEAEPGSLAKIIDIRQHIEKEYIVDIKDHHGVSEIIKEVCPDIILHLAAQSLVLEGYRKPRHTWESNLLGTLNVCSAAYENLKEATIIVVTTDKVYKNKESMVGYKEEDEIGGKDPYSASKAAVEMLVESMRNTYKHRSAIKLVTVRAGNVIGGGDWSKDRIVPDIIRANINDTELTVRNPNAIRPWQHVLDPLNGYLRVCEKIHESNNRVNNCYNFGPTNDSHKTVKEIIEEASNYWKPKWRESDERETSRDEYSKTRHM